MSERDFHHSQEGILFGEGDRPDGYWLLATGYWLLATGYWLLASRVMAPLLESNQYLALRRGLFYPFD